ncbi:MAG: hypothetical protein R3332_12930 [Pseudohongiellaceae bacterium]|nr:hypothetical protein [Pseudohongiellaceae bacterium]
MKFLPLTQLSVIFALVLTIATPSMAQNTVELPTGVWKYLGGYVFIHIDEDRRAFQCRIDRDMNVYMATASVAGDGNVSWSPTRFFSIYGKEIDLGGQTWGEGTLENRGRILFSTDSSERLELDPIEALPTICQYYLKQSA